MRKRVFPRFVLALFLSLTAFVLLSAMQFARYGSFTRQLGGMVISGRYFNGAADETAATRPGLVRLDGGVNVFFAGLEFQLAYSSGAGGGFALVDSDNARHQIVPEYFSTAGHEAVFFLPSGAELSFASHIPEGSPGAVPELRISGTFPEGIQAIDIPFRPRRASVAWDNSRGILGVTYDGSRHRFSRHSQELTEGRLVLPVGNPTIFYRAIPSVIVNDPADFVVPGMESAQAFSEKLAGWTDRSFELWGRNMPANVDEDRVIAFGAEALRRGTYGAAMSVVPFAFGHSQNRTWESAVYQLDSRVGIWERGVRDSFAAEERKVGLVSELLARRDYGRVFSHNRLIEFLAVRGHDAAIDGLVLSAWGIDPSVLTLGSSAGILESYTDMMTWRAGADNPFEPLAARARELVADGLRQNGNQVLVFSSDGHADLELNLRLGMALRKWGEQTGNGDWAALGRSLVFSVLALGGEDGSVPAVVTSGANGTLSASSGWIGSASLFRMLDENEFLPRAMATGVNDIWAWTAARSVNLVQAANFIDVFVDFPVGQTHYLKLRNVGSFPLLQIYGQNTSRNPDFEEHHNVSGWNHFEDEQTLVVKLQHRTNVERIRILFTVPPPPPVVQAAPAPVVAPPPVQEAAPAEDLPMLPPPPIRTRPPTWTPPPVSPPVPPFFIQGGIPQS